MSARAKSSGAVQFSLFGAEAAEPVLDDLDGVLLGGGHWARLGGTARLSIIVADRWRAVALVGEFTARDVAAQTGAVEPAHQGFVARTAFSAALSPQAARWTRGANQGAPPGLVLTAGALRLWVIAAGWADGGGYLISTAASGDSVHLIAGAQLARLGLAAVSLANRPGPGWRITSVKRLRRLAELLGEAPEGAGADWPC
jgi:hypothetical protein